MKWHEIERDYQEAAAGSFLVFAAMLTEWGVPLKVAVRGIRLAYAMQHLKRSSTTGASRGRPVRRNRGKSADG